MKHSAKILLLAFFTTGMLLVESCKKYEISPVDPVVSNSGLTDNKATIQVGDSIVLKPVVEIGDKPITYIWIRNDSIVHEGYNYTFNGSERGVFTVQFKAINRWNSTPIVYTITVQDRYENGVFILNEGWFGNTKGSVNFWHTGADTIETNVFETNNPGKTLGTTTQFGAINDGKIYLISKESSSLVVAEAVSMKETGRIEVLPAGGRSFLALSTSDALISTADGIYKLSLSPLAMGAKIEGIEGESGNMVKSGNTIFVFTKNQGVVAIDATSYAVVKEIGVASAGLVESQDGSVWYAYTNGLVKLNPATLDADTVAVNVNIPGVLWDFEQWNAGSLAYSEADDAIFFLNDNGFDGSSIVYRYKIGEASFSDVPFLTLPANRVFYGAGIRVNQKTNELVATTLQPGFGDNSKFNDLVIYDASTAAQVKKISYEGFWFPAIPVFLEAD